MSGEDGQLAAIEMETLNHTPLPQLRFISRGRTRQHPRNCARLFSPKIDCCDKSGFDGRVCIACKRAIPLFNETFRTKRCAVLAIEVAVIIRETGWINTSSDERRLPLQSPCREADWQHLSEISHLTWKMSNVINDRESETIRRITYLRSTQERENH